MKILNLEGNIVPEVRYPYLCIKWHRALKNVRTYDVYCHSAMLRFKSNDISDLAKVEVVCKISYIGDKDTYKSYDKHISVYLPAFKHEDIVSVPINSDELIKAISLNDWTKSPKTKKRVKLIGRAIRISWKYAEKDYSYEFLPADNQSPAMMCKPYTDLLADEEKTDTCIVLSQNNFSNSLFD